MTDPSIAVHGLFVRRGGKIVLSGVDLSIERGRVTGLLGPSGSGKTTLMRSIVGVQIVQQGTVTRARRGGGLARLRRRVGYVTQAASVYDDLTVSENLRYFADVLSATGSNVDDALETVGLRAQPTRSSRRCPGASARACRSRRRCSDDREVLILDEPTVGLDPVLRRDLWATFHRLAEGGATLVVSSHVMDEAARCDELILMREGRIVASGTPDSLLERAGTDDLDAAFLELVESRA